MSPRPGAHDADVGIDNYVPGWFARGHNGYLGFAWYRLRVSIASSDPDPRLALAGPAALDSAYQVYFDGALMGSEGDFSTSTPSAGSIQPKWFALPKQAGDGKGHVVALRVWLDPSEAAGDAGGLHVAPVLGTAGAVADLVRLQWLKVFEGYVVDAVEPVAFLILATMAAARSRALHRAALSWLAGALVVLALLRANQVLLFWTRLESLHTYDCLRNVVLTPLTLMVWVFAWAAWFDVRRLRMIFLVTMGVSVSLMVVQLASRTWFWPAGLSGLEPALHRCGALLRWVALAIYVGVLVGTGKSGRLCATGILSRLAAVLVGIGLFANELSAIGVPGIWFPFGVGVSRTQYAFAASIPVLFALLVLPGLRMGSGADWFRRATHADG